MRPFASVISLEEARRRLDRAVRPIDRVERIGLAEASGRVAAADIASAIAVPSFARSAMDGYAVVSADTASATRTTPVSLKIVERIFTGQTPRHLIQSGTCAEIATGAPIPEGADAVIMVEETMSGGQNMVALLAPATAGQNVGRQGADISPGDVIIRRGYLLTPGRIGAIAAIGHEGVEVFARPRVLVLSTGDEVIDPGQPLAAGQVYDVNRFTMAAVISAHGGVPELHRPVEDTLDALVAALDRSAGADIIVFSGGSSVGDRDLVVDLVQKRGEMVFHGIAVKPGKPTAFALVGGKPFFGMPGNPTSCLSNAYILLAPFLRTTARLPPAAPVRVRTPLGKRIVSAAGRHQFYAVRLQNGTALPAFKGSGEITSLSQADGYIEIPADRSTVEEGELVEVTLF